MKYSYNGFVRIRQLKYALYLHHIVVMYISYSSWNTILEFCTISHKCIDSILVYIVQIFLQKMKIIAKVSLVYPRAQFTM